MKLSFIIPAFNASQVLGEAIESALAQDLSIPAEVVVVDDGSTDATRTVAEGFANRFPGRVTVASHESNRGGGAARNTAVKFATGDLLYVLDADNVLPRNCVAAQLAKFRETGIEAVSVGRVHYFADSISNVVGGLVLRNEAGRSTLRHLFQTAAVPASHGNYLFTRRLFDECGGYDEDPGPDTWTFGLKHLARGFEVGIADTYYHHRLNPPGGDSYWMRLAKLGIVDGSAIVVLKRESARLPDDIREMVTALSPRDHFFALLDLGAFGRDFAYFRDARRAERIERGALLLIRRALRVAAATRNGFLRRSPA